MMTSTSLKTMLFVSVVVTSSAMLSSYPGRQVSALPPDVQQKVEEDRIRTSPHMKQLLAFPLGLITGIKVSESKLANIDGYDILTPYIVSTVWTPSPIMPLSIQKDYTVYAVAAKPLAPSDINGVIPSKAHCGPIHFGLFFAADDYVEYKDPADGQSGVVNSSQNGDSGNSKPIPVSPVIPVSPIPTPVYLNEHPLNPNAQGQAVLERLGEIGYITERRSVATNPQSSSMQLRILPFRAKDDSIVECKLVNVTPRGLKGGQVYQQQFIAKKFGSTTVTNGLATYTIQVGLLK